MYENLQLHSLKNYVYNNDVLKEILIGHRPSHFQFNTVVKAFILSETLLWSGWNFVIPVFPIFAATRIPGGNIVLAATAYSTYLLMRLIFDVISSRYLLQANEMEKFLITILGIIMVSMAFLGFAFSFAISHLFIFYGIAGVGIGIGYPAKLSLFSTHLDKNKETLEWGLSDTAVIGGTALAASLGGFVATEYGFKTLFILASLISVLGTLPYILYLHKDKRSFLHRITE